MLNGISANLACIQVALYTPNNRGGFGAPVLFTGGPGVGKTWTLEAAGTPAGLPVVTLSPGSSGEGAFGVVPTPRKTYGDDGSPGPTVLDYPIPAYVESAFGGPDGKGILFIDEVTSSPDHILPALLGLVASGTIGFTRLGKRIRVLGACNPPEIAADGRELPAPLANRFLWLPWAPPTANEVVSYLSNAGALRAHTDGAVSQSSEAIEKQVLAAWDSAWARTVGIHAGYLRSQCAGDSNGAPVYDYPKDHAKAGGPWASPRSWENALRALTTARILGVDSEIRSAFLAGGVGNGHADAWETYETNADLPCIEDVLDRKVAWKLDERRPDRAVAVIAGAHTILCNKASAENTDANFQALRKTRADNFWELLDAAPASCMDLVASAAMGLTSANLYSNAKGSKSAPVLRKLGKIVGK